MRGAARAGLALVAAALALPLPRGAGAEGWAGFYRSPTAVAAPNTTPDTTPDTLPGGGPAPAASAAALPSRGAADACLRAIRAAERRYAIPGHLLLAIGLQEAGLSRGGRLTVWPWSVNAGGEGRMFASAAAAKAWVRAQRAAGQASVDVGCMQVNLRWHPRAFADLDRAFDPATNVDYAARFLVDLHRRTGDWMAAAGAYHSFQPDARRKYLARLERNIAVAQAGRLGLGAGGGVVAGGTRLAALDAPGAGTAGTGVAGDVPAAPALPMPKVLWSAALSDSNETGHVSIYSRRALQPILPRFTQEF